MPISMYFPGIKMFLIHIFIEVHLNMEHTAYNKSNLKTQKTYFYVRIVTIIIDKVGNYPASASKGTPIIYFQFHTILNVVVIFIM